MHLPRTGPAAARRDSAPAGARQNSGIASSSSALSSCSRLKATSAADQRTGLARLDAGREQEEQRVEVVLLRHDAVLAQILGDHRGRDAVRPHIRPCARSKPGVSSVSLFGIGHGKTRRDAREAVPRRARRELPDSAGLLASSSVPIALPGTSCTPPSVAAVRIVTRSGTNGSKNQRRAGSRLLLLELAAHRADLLAQLDAEPDRVVPQHLARAALHHLRADVERGEQRIERRGRGVLHEAFVEAPMLDPPALAADVAILHVDLRGLREARELLVGRLGGDDAGRVVARGRRAPWRSGRHRAGETS